MVESGMSELIISIKEIITPIGQMLAAATDKGVFFLGFAENPDSGFRLKKAAAELGGTFKIDAADAGDLHLLKLDEELKEYFKGHRRQFTIPVVLSGTDFQKKVWETLTRIPYGKTWSYSRQAAEVANPKAVRAVGSANGKNRIVIVIPCHRVITKDNGLGGYSGGLWRKKYLLKREGSRIT